MPLLTLAVFIISVTVIFLISFDQHARRNADLIAYLDFITSRRSYIISPAQFNSKCIILYYHAQFEHCV